MKRQGIFVVIIGPDGSGKSTLSGLLCARLNHIFRKTWRFHWRPNLLPKLGKNIAQNGTHGTHLFFPPETSKDHGLVSLIRFFYYWLDFILGYWLLIYPRKAQMVLVIGERYFPDVIVNPERYGFALPSWLLRLSAKFVPSPDLLILLKDDPEIIFARKPELSLKQIALQIEKYEKEIPYWGKYEVLTTEGGAQYVAKKVEDLMMLQSADSSSRRRELREHTPLYLSDWRGFSSVSGIKVWISNRDTVSNALHLYHPYSQRGKRLKGFVCSLPNPLAHFLLTQSPGDAEAGHFHKLANTIRKTLNDKSLVVSFSRGTPGHHRKLTAQVSQDKKIIAYVKIGRGKQVLSLLEQEKKTLLADSKFDAPKIVLPKVLAFASHDEENFLFLSAPEQPGKQRPVAVGEKDVLFLENIGSKPRETSSVKAIFSRIKQESRLHNIGPVFQELVDHAYQSVSGLLGDSGVRVGHCHGDYAPWNTLDLEDGSLYVYDWEYASASAPLLLDLFHRVYMPLRLVLCTSPNEAVKQLLHLPLHPHLGAVVKASGIQKKHLPAYLLLYLLDQGLREAEQAGRVSEYILESLRLTLRESSRPRRRILVSAYACEPDQGSEPGVGWNWVQQIAKDHEAWVITRKNNEPGIEAAMREVPNRYLHFEYVDLPRWACFWKRKERGIRTYYYLWQFAALFHARALHQRVKFDLGHHITFVNDWLWTFFALMPIPYVWGPIGSHPKAPPQLLPNACSRIKDRLRILIQGTMRCIDPLFWLSVHRAHLVLVINKQVATQSPFRCLSKEKLQIEPAIGIDHTETNKPKTDRKDLHILFVGRFVPVKAPHLALEAFALFAQKGGCGHFTLIGQGQEEGNLRKLAKKHSIEDKTEFIPWLPRRDVFEMMRGADIFLFPSLEGGGMVVLEAMSLGLAVVCLHFGGPGEMVTEACGILAPVGSANETLRSLADALIRISSDGEMRGRQHLGAIEHAKTKYLWSSKQKKIRKWYIDGYTKRGNAQQHLFDV